MPVMKQLRIGSEMYDTVGEASVTQVLTSGTKIATVTIDGTATDLYAPEGGSSIDPASAPPLMDGTAAAGTSTDYARADHVHPTDTSRAAASHTHAIADVTGLQTALDGKQGTLVSGTSIKTVNGTSLLGSGDVTIPTYTLPAATTSTLGGVKVGDGLSVAVDGTLSSTGMVILEYGVSTWVECLEAIEANRVVYCKVPSSSTNSRMAFLAWRESSKFEFQYYRSVSSHTDSQQGDEIWVYSLNRGDAVTGYWTTTTRQAYTRVVAGDGLSSAYNSGVLTLSLDPASSGGLLVTCYGGGNNIAMDKTAQDIYDALSAGIMPVFRSTLTGSATNGFTSLSRANFDTTPITITLASNAQQYEAASMSDYPRVDTGGSN